MVRVTIHKLAFVTAVLTVILAVTLIVRYDSHLKTDVDLPNTSQQPCGEESLGASPGFVPPSQQRPPQAVAVGTINAGLLSNAWRPLVFTQCLLGMPRTWAPCMAPTSRVLGEEIVYPDFKILPPRFLHHNHERQWAQAAERKPQGSTRDTLYVPYQNQHGQNYVLLNFTYSGAPHTHWGRGGCMVDEGSVDVLELLKSSATPAKHHNNIMFAASPDGHSFQHFLDRVAPMLIQASHLHADPGAMYMAHRPR